MKDLFEVLLGSIALDLSRLKGGRFGKEIARLEEILSGRRIAVAYSGGVDSTLLAVLADKFSEVSVALTVISPLLPKRQVQGAASMARHLHLQTSAVSLDLLSVPEVRKNRSDRCYHCKRAMYLMLGQRAKEMGLESLLDGTNLDDIDEARPGLRALRELGVETPFLEAGLGKAAIRSISRQIGLPNWNLPSNSCLATRIPFGRHLSLSRLTKVEKAESLLANLGYRVFRVRDHGDIARIELGPQELEGTNLGQLRSQIVQRFREIGYRRVALDLTPYGEARPKPNHDQARENSAIRKDLY